MSEIMNIEMMKLLFLYNKVGVTRHGNENLSSSLRVLKDRNKLKSLKVAKSKDDVGSGASGC